MIDYKLLDDSIAYYSKHNFTRIETPWLVSKYCDEITKPKEIPSYELVHNGKCLVASGEQSFLYLYMKECLPLGTFQTITPCFRADRPDNRHSKWFMKNELIKTDKVNQSNLDKIIDTAYNFYKQYFNNLDVIKTDIGYDIEVEGNELGSYGIRSCEFLDWIYGTGCAEPRTSKLIKLYGKNNKKDGVLKSIEVENHIMDCLVKISFGVNDGIGQNKLFNTNIDHMVDNYINLKITLDNLKIKLSEEELKFLNYWNPLIEPTNTYGYALPPIIRFYAFNTSNYIEFYVTNFNKGESYLTIDNLSLKSNYYTYEIDNNLYTFSS